MILFKLFLNCPGINLVRICIKADIVYNLLECSKDISIIYRACREAEDYRTSFQSFSIVVLDRVACSKNTS